MTDRSIRIGVDVGGTFTDLVLIDAVGKTAFAKVLTTHEDLSRAMLAGIARLTRDGRLSPGDVDAIVHATTVVTNAVIERKGATVGLLTTHGFRDTLEIGREARYDIYDLFLEKPRPLVPRRLRHEVRERVDAAGAVLQPMHDEDVDAAAAAFRDAGVEAVAVCFMHSYRAPEHERRARAILAAALPGVPITLSSEIAPEIREYDRTNTACANAYVQPLVGRYLARLESELASRGFRGALHLMLSAGGLATVGMARDQPIQLIESGPAAGAIAASHIARSAGIADLVSFDMGGTTAKACLIRDGQAQRASEFEAARVRRFRKGSGLPLKVPVVDLIEIGAGGGSIARVDAMGLLKVGPESAGSEPGPIAYGRGGTLPTVTDADLVLGYLSPDYFLGGEMALDVERARRGIEAHLAHPLGLTIEQAAAGVHAVVNDAMAAAARMHVVESGGDPRRCALLAFGGAGPVHAYGLAKLLRSPRVIVPPGAGVLSALGLMVAPPAVDLARGFAARLRDADWAAVNGIFAELEERARALLGMAGAPPEDVAISRSADMRYVGQGYEIRVALPDGAFGPASAADLHERFLATYQGLFDRRIEDVDAETLVWRIHASARAPGQAPTAAYRAGGGAGVGEPLKGSRGAFFPSGGYRACPVYDRAGLGVGQRLPGPALIEERETTVVVGPDASFAVDEHLNIVIDIDLTHAAAAGVVAAAEPMPAATGR